MWFSLLTIISSCILLTGVALGNDDQTSQTGPSMNSSTAIQIHPIGVVKRQGDRTLVELRPELAPALDGLTGFSHVWVFYWFHENDRPDERATLKVHPRRDPATPLTGVFATRSPVRPNLIGFTCGRIVGVKGNVLEVEGLDAREGSPVVDLKPYIPASDALPDAQVPGWVKTTRGGGDN
jgi:tRNA (adenine37-N6)-methyltransferase